MIPATLQNRSKYLMHKLKHEFLLMHEFLKLHNAKCAADHTYYGNFPRLQLLQKTSMSQLINDCVPM